MKVFLAIIWISIVCVTNFVNYGKTFNNRWFDTSSRCHAVAVTRSTPVRIDRHLKNA